MSSRRLVLALFFFSGAAGLAYEIVWVRWAGTLLGSTVQATGVVVSVFLGGLGAGAWIAGRVAERLSTAALLRLYGALELGIGITAPLVPAAFRALEPLVARMWESTFVPAAAAGACLLVPALLMGATLPVLVRWLALQGAPAPRQVSVAYGTNTMGGVVGVVAAGFWLLPAVGLARTAWTAAAINFGVGAVALALARRPRVAARGPEPEAGSPRGRTAWACAAALVSGFAALVYQVAWTQALVLTLGTTVQAFTVILAAFILGLGVGGALSSRGAGDPARTLAFLQAAVAVLALAVHPMLGNLPASLLPVLTDVGDSFGLFIALQAVVSGIFVFLPACVMGAAFPIACRMAMGAGVARPVGAVYLYNTVGTIAGALVASFAAIPRLGLDRTIVAAAGLNLALCAALLAWARDLRRWAPVPLAAGAAAALLLPRWEIGLLSGGVYLYSPSYRERLEDAKDARDVILKSRGRLLDYRWDAYGLVAVHEFDEGQRSLSINGKFDASTRGGDVFTQQMLGHLGPLHARRLDTALVVGFGCGMTLQAVQAHPFSRTACVEISPGVVSMAGHFSEANGNALADPRLTLRVADARRVLRYDPARYDVISSEPSNLWVRGMAGLFTEEAFRAARERLAPGGVMVQWLHAYLLDADDFRTVMRTFYAVFPQGAVYEARPGGDYLMLGWMDGSGPTFTEVEARFAGVRAAMAESGLADGSDLAAHLLMDAAAARQFAGEGPVLTDDRCPVEFTAPRSMWGHGDPRLLETLAPIRERIPGVMAGLPPAALERRRMRGTLARALLQFYRRDVEGALETLAGVPAEYRARSDWRLPVDQVTAAAIGMAERSVGSGDLSAALRVLGRITPLSGHFDQARLQMAWIWAKQGSRDDALRELDELLKRDPANARAKELRDQLRGWWRARGS
jgi:predicted membrane-bound spermidine synthase